MASVRVRGTEIRQSPVQLRAPSIALRFRWWLLWWALTFLVRVVIWLVRHPRFTGIVGAGVLAWRIWTTVGTWPLVVAAGVLVLLLGLWAWRWGESFARVIGWRVRGCWRRLVEYRTRWPAAMLTTKLTAKIGDAHYLPQLVRVRSTGSVDVVTVRLLPGQVLTDWAQVGDRLAATFGALDCRVRTPEHRLPSWLRWLPWGNGRGLLVLWFLTRDPLTEVVQPAAPSDPPNLKALTVGRREDGPWYRLKLLGTHLLLVGATGAGKSSAIWTILAELGPGIRTGLVKIWALDPKGGMELALGRRLFDRFCYGGDDTAGWEDEFAGVLEDAVRIMRERQNRLRGFTRSLKPSIAEPFVVIVIDELVSLTGFVVDRDAKRRINSALGLLLAQGRAVGITVIGATTDPRKELLQMRDGFPTRVCLRVTEPEHVKLVLADGARDRGARCDLIPESLPGVGFVGIDGIAEPLRVRFANWTDQGITTLVDRYTHQPENAANTSGTADLKPVEVAA